MNLTRAYMGDRSYTYTITVLLEMSGVTSVGAITERERHVHVLGEQVKDFYIKERIEP